MTEVNNTLPPNDGRTYHMTANGWVEDKAFKPAEEQKWLKPAAAAKEAGCAYTRIIYAIQRGYLKASVVASDGRKNFYRINEYDLIDYIENPSTVKCDPIKGTYYGDKQIKESKKEKITDISSVATKIQAIIDEEIAKVKQQYETKLKEEYNKGFEDGKLSVEHDDDAAYRRGLEEGKKQAKDNLLTLIKEVG